MKNIEKTETQGKLTTIPASCPFCGGHTNILTLLAKPEFRKALLKLGAFIAACVLLRLYFTGQLPLDALVAVLQLFSKLL